MNYLFVVFFTEDYVIRCVFFCKQQTAYELRISDWSSDVCSSDLLEVKLDVAEAFFADQRIFALAIGARDRGRRAVPDDPRRRLRLPRIERRAVEQHDGVGGRGAGDGAGRDHRRMRTVRIVTAPLSAGQHRPVLEPGLFLGGRRAARPPPGSPPRTPTPT